MSRRLVLLLLGIVFGFSLVAYFRGCGYNQPATSSQYPVQSDARLAWSTDRQSVRADVGLPLPLPHGIVGASFSPDGREVVVTLRELDGSGNEIFRLWIAASDGSLRPITDGPADFSPRWSSSGDDIAFLERLSGPTTRALDTETGEISDLVNRPDVSYRSLAWAPDGAALAAYGSTTRGGPMLRRRGCSSPESRTVPSGTTRSTPFLSSRSCGRPMVKPWCWITGRPREAGWGRTWSAQSRSWT
jgi:hypothetical protein